MTITQNELFIAQAPKFNFELNSDQLLAKALQVGFITKVGNDKYLVNKEY